LMSLEGFGAFDLRMTKRVRVAGCAWKFATAEDVSECRN